MVHLGKIVMIHDLKKQGLSISLIARKTGLDRKTVRKSPDRGLESPSYGPRSGGKRLLDDCRSYLVERLEFFPGLSARRLHREVRAFGFSGG